MVGSIGNFQIVAQLLIAERVLNPILFSTRVAKRSLVEAEVTCTLFRIRLLQSSVKQLSEYYKLEVFLEG